LINPTIAPMTTQSKQAIHHGRPCCVWSPFANTCEIPRIDATDRSKLLEAMGIITANATSALIERLFTID
jgi:hypothetical protein